MDEINQLNKVEVITTPMKIETIEFDRMEDSLNTGLWGDINPQSQLLFGEED